MCVQCDESCERPALLLDYEETCKTDPEVTGNTGSFLEQLQENIAAAVEQGRRLINMARKKLGISYEEPSADEKIKKVTVLNITYSQPNMNRCTDFIAVRVLSLYIPKNECGKRNSFYI